MEERLVRNEEVVSSNLIGSTRMKRGRPRDRPFSWTPKRAKPLATDSGYRRVFISLRCLHGAEPWSTSAPPEAGKPFRFRKARKPRRYETSSFG